MKAYGGVEVELHSFLALASDGSQCSASCPDLFIFGMLVLLFYYLFCGFVFQALCFGCQKQ
jgi:hypothetical protein